MALSKGYHSSFNPHFPCAFVSSFKSLIFLLWPLFFFVIFSFTSLFFMYVHDMCKFSTCNTDITSCLDLLVTVLQIAVTGVRILAGQTHLYLLQSVQTGSGAHPVYCLILILLTWRIWWAPNNASKLQTGFKLAFKGLMVTGVLYRGQSGQSVNSTTHLHPTSSQCGRRNLCVTSGFRHKVADNCAFPGLLRSKQW